MTVVLPRIFVDFLNEYFRLSGIMEFIKIINIWIILNDDIRIIEKQIMSYITAFFPVVYCNIM